MNTHRGWLAVGALGLTLLCSVSPRPTWNPVQTASRDLIQAISPAAVLRGSPPLDNALRAAFIAAEQAAAPRSYDLEGGAALNEQQRFHARFDDAGVEVVPQGTGTPPLRLRLDALNCGGEHQKLSPGRREIARNRVSYTRPELGLDEWFVHGPLGLEQGFSLEGNPCPGKHEVVLEVRASGGLVPRLDDATKGVRFERDGAPTGLRYDELHAKDAAGKTLRSWMTVEDERIALHVDTSEARFPVVIDPLLWQQQATLEPSEENWSPSNDHIFSTSVALFGKTALIGHPHNSSQGERSGAAYVFVRSGTTWNQQARLVASDGVEGTNLGWTVALGENIAAISNSWMGVGFPPSAVYVFERTGSCWVQKAKLSSPDQEKNDYFGGSLAIDETTLLVGSAGAAYVFERERGSWVQKQKLTTALAQPDALFGSSVAIEGDAILVGASGTFTSSLPGAVYVFHRDASGWSEQTKLLPPESLSRDHFGTSVALRNNTALVGAPGVFGGIEGAAYLFSRDDEIWTYQTKLACPDSTQGFDFGHGVAIDGDLAVIASLDRYGAGHAHQNDAVAYVFQREAGTWNLDRKIPEKPNEEEDLGKSVALSHKTLLLGAPGHFFYQYKKAGTARIYTIAQEDKNPCSAENLFCIFGCENGECSSESNANRSPEGSLTCSGSEAGCSLRPGSPGSPAASRLLWALFCLGVFRRRLAR
jgi:hypothetical protein